MSEQSVHFIIGRAVVDPEFRELLFSNPEKAIEGFELTERESAAMMELDREEFDAASSEIEERISRAGLGLQSFIKVEGLQDIELKNVMLEDLYVRWFTAP